MRSLFYFFTTMLIVPILFTSFPVSGQELDGNMIISKMGVIKKEAEKAIQMAHIQLKEAVLSGKRKQIALAAKMLKNAMMNQAIADDFLTTLKDGGIVSVQHAKACSDIAYTLTITAGYLSTGNIKKVGTNLLKVEKLAKNQPQPENPERVSRKINEIKESVVKFAEVEKIRGTLLSKADIARDVMNIDSVEKSKK